jgi:glycerophosphoryl diester phosphodiesterase
MECVVLAHRGASAYAPENTLASFYKAIELGAKGIETDLQKTKDGVIFLFHDNVLDKKSDKKGAVVDYTWAELQEADVGSWFSPKYKGERLITFEQFLIFFGRRDLLFAIELKSLFIESEVREIIRLIDEYDARKKTTITSFVFGNLKTTRDVDKNIRIGYVLNKKIDNDVIRQLESIDSRQVYPPAELITPDQVKLAHHHGLEVIAWGIQNVEIMNNMINLGVDGIIIDFPDKLIKALKMRPQI